MLRIEPRWRSIIDPLDVMQVTYIEAFLRIRSFDPARGVPFAVWLRVIAENNLRDAIRGLSRQKRPPPMTQMQPTNYEDSLLGLHNLIAANGSTPSGKLRRDETCQMIERAVSALPESYRQVVRSYDLEGRSIEEVTRKMGRSSGAIYMMRARAHQRLREMLGSESRFFG